jgi:hypothetical protein
MEDQATSSKPSRAEQRATKGLLVQRLVRHLSTWVEGSDYKDRFLRLAKQHALSDLVGRRGYFRARGRKFDCIITGVVVRLRADDDYLIINYTTEAGDYIEGAEIDRASFRLANA